MARIEFEANGHKVVVEGVEPHQVGIMVGSLVATFDGIDQASKQQPERVVRDTYRVESQTGGPYAYRNVKHYGNGVFECDCPGFEHRGYCRHTVAALGQHRLRYGYK